MSDNLVLFLVKHDLESALYNLERCDCYGLLSDAMHSASLALEFVEEEIARRKSA